jgi:hypothetical protein
MYKRADNQMIAGQSNQDGGLAGMYNAVNPIIGQMNNGRGMMLGLNDNYQGGPVGNGITNEMRNSNQRQTYGPLTLSNGAIYTGELMNGMKDGYG